MLPCFRPFGQIIIFGLEAVQCSRSAIIDANTCGCAARGSILDDADLGQLEVTACTFLTTNDVIEYPPVRFLQLWLESSD
jgi:hypothetical protein